MRKGQAFEDFGESSVCTTFSSLPWIGAGISTRCSLPAEASAGKRPGCCGIFGPGPSATLDKATRRHCGKTESLYFDLMIHVKGPARRG